MRILIFSDTHGRTAGCMHLLENMQHCTDAVLHAGDIGSDVTALQQAFPNLKIYGVSGNNDFHQVLPTEQVLEFDGVKLFLTHGHRYKVKYTYEDLILAAQARGASIAVFGHTHQSCDRTEDGIHLINPGSAGGIWPTYAVIEIENGEIRTDIISLR